MSNDEVNTRRETHPARQKAGKLRRTSGGVNTNVQTTANKDIPGYR